MKVYILTADIYDESFSSSIELFGIFSTEEKAKKQASEMKLDCYDIAHVTIDETKENFYLGGYME